MKRIVLSAGEYDTERKLLQLYVADAEAEMVANSLRKAGKRLEDKAEFCGYNYPFVSVSDVEEMSLTEAKQKIANFYREELKRARR